MAIVDGVGRPIFAGSEVTFRRLVAERPRVTTEGGRVLFLFDFCDEHPPEIEVETRVGIVTEKSRNVGGCWKFDGLLVNLARVVPRFTEV